MSSVAPGPTPPSTPSTRGRRPASWQAFSQKTRMAVLPFQQQRQVAEVRTASNAVSAFTLDAPEEGFAKLGADHEHPADATPPLPFFDGLQPLVYMAALLGLMPISFKPLRVSFSPLRSTLCWALCVQGFVLWSGYHSFRYRFGALLKLAEEQAGDGALDEGDWKKQFMAFGAIVHTICWAVTPIAWMESAHVPDTEARCQQFTRQFGHLLDRSGARADLRRTWVVVVLADVVLGFTANGVYGLFVERGLPPYQYGSHFYSHALVGHTAISIWFACRRIRLVATTLAAQLQKELEGGVLTPQRVHEFQRGWQQLCALNVNIVFTPLGFTLLVILMLTLITFYTYSALVQIGSSLKVGTAVMVTDAPYVAVLFVVYRSAHYSAETIRNAFMQVLQKPRWPIVDEFNENELQKFLEVVRWNSPVVSVGGYFKLNMSSFNALMAAITTYVIVILQLQLSLPMSDDPPETTPTIQSTTPSTCV